MVILSLAILNILVEILVTILPIPIVMKLRLRLRERIGICILLGAGVIVVAVGAVKSWYTWMTFFGSYDELWYSGLVWICAMVELNAGIVSHGDSIGITR